MDLEEVRAFIRAHEWKFASSMPKNPHWYVVREQCRDDEEFRRFVEFIRSHGYDGNFFAMKLRYLDVDGHKYWTMGYRTGATVIINRAEISRADEMPRSENPFPFEAKEWEEDAHPAGGEAHKQKYGEM